MLQRSQFTFYSSFWTAIQNQAESVQNAYLRAVIQFSLYGTEPSADMDAVARSLFELTRPTLVASRKKAKEGKQGGKSTQNVKCKHFTENASYGSPLASDTCGSKKEGEIEKEIEIEGEKENKCSFLQGAAPQQDALRVPTKEKESFFLYPVTVNRLQEAHPTLDVVQELRKLISWCERNPDKRKPMREVLPFVYRWMERAEGSREAPKASEEEVHLAWMRRMAARAKEERR